MFTLMHVTVDICTELCSSGLMSYMTNINICVVIKQNELEVSSVLVSEILFRFNYVNVNFKPDTCRKCLIDATQI